MRNQEKTKKEKYIEDLFAGETPEREYAHKLSCKIEKDPISIGPVEGKLLQFLVHLSQAEKIVEIGTLTGYSTLWMAEALPPQGKIYTLEKDAQHAEMAKDVFHRSPYRDQIQLLHGDAREKLKELEPHAPFDLVFIDANKGAYLDYLHWAETHLRVGGLIVGDNTFLFGTVYDSSIQTSMSQKHVEVMKNFNKELSDTRKFHSLLLPTHEGMTLAIKK